MKLLLKYLFVMLILGVSVIVLNRMSFSGNTCLQRAVYYSCCNQQSISSCAATANSTVANSSGEGVKGSGRQDEHCENASTMAKDYFYSKNEKTE